MLVLDIDYFKSINDTHGHDAGDDVLREFALRIRKSIRGIDLACRYGGEEFVVVMPETDMAVATMVAERLRRRIATEPFAIQQGARNLEVTISIGIAASRGKDDNAASVLKRADRRSIAPSATAATAWCRTRRKLTSPCGKSCPHKARLRRPIVDRRPLGLQLTDAGEGAGRIQGQMIFPPSPFHSGLARPNLTAWQFFGTRWQPFGPQVVTPPWIVPPPSCCFGLGAGCADGRGAGASAMQNSPLTRWPLGHTSGQLRLLIPRSALIASGDMASGRSIEVSLTNWRHATLVSSLEIAAHRAVETTDALELELKRARQFMGIGRAGDADPGWNRLQSVVRPRTDVLFGNSAMNRRNWIGVLTVLHQTDTASSAGAGGGGLGTDAGVGAAGRLGGELGRYRAQAPAWREAPQGWRLSAAAALKPSGAKAAMSETR